MQGESYKLYNVVSYCIIFALIQVEDYESNILFKSCVNMQSGKKENTV